MGLVKGFAQRAGSLLGVRTLRQHAHHLTGDLKGILFAVLARRVKTMHTWDAFVEAHNLTDTMLKAHYEGRRHLAFALMVGFVLCLVFMVLSAHPMVSLGSLVIVIALYLSNAFRLYQLRYCTLCPFGTFYRVALRDARELFPSRLPSAWQARGSSCTSQ